MATFVLVPGAGGASWYWHLVATELRGRGHEAIAIQLPAADPSAGLEEYAALVTQASGDRQGLVMVGQSLGGFTASLVSARLPVSLLVLVNAMIPKPGETAGQWWSDTGQPQAQRANDIAEGRDPDADLDESVYFLHDVPPEALATGTEEVQPQSGTIFGDVWPLDRWPAVPTRVLVGREDRLFPAELQIRIAKERLGLTAEVIPGGHLLALANPITLTDRLESYLAEL
jgi:pimeloyl-ACP methyl ester carboxylesterase